MRAKSQLQSRIPVRSRLEDLQQSQNLSISALSLTKPLQAPNIFEAKYLDVPLPPSLFNSSAQFPSAFPKSPEERIWFSHELKNFRTNTVQFGTKKNILVILQLLNEFGRHIAVQHQQTSNDPYHELSLQIIQLTQYAFEEIKLTDLDMSQIKSSFEVKAKEINVEAETLRKELKIEIAKSAQYQYQISSLSQAQAQLQQQVIKLEREIVQQKNEFAATQAQLQNAVTKSFFNTVNFTHSFKEKDKDKETNLDKLMEKPPRPKSVFSSQKVNRELLSPQRELVSQTDTQLNKTSKTKQDSLDYSKITRTQGNEHSVIQETTSKQLEAELDSIPPVQYVSTRVKSGKPEAFSRVKEAERLIFDNLNYEASQMLDCRPHQENVVETKLKHIEIVNLISTEFNPLTKEILLSKHSADAQRAQQGANKNVDQLQRPQDDAGFQLEQQAQSRLQNKNDLQNIAKARLEIQLKQPAFIIQQKLNPMFDPKTTNLNIQFTQAENQICHPVFRSKLQGVLSAIWDVGGMQTVRDVMEQLEQTEIFSRTSTLSKRSMSYSKTPKLDLKQQNSLNQPDEQPTNSSKIPQVIIQYQKKNAKLQPTFPLLLQFYVQTVLSSKQAQFTFYGLKTKPMSFLAKQIDPLIISQFIECIQDKEFEKSYTDSVTKRYKFYKQVMEKSTELEVSEAVLGFKLIQSQLMKSSFNLIGLDSILQFIDRIIVKRQALLQQQLNYDKRVYVAFPQQVYQMVLQENSYDKNQADRFIISLLYSCSCYCCYLDLITEEQKTSIITELDCPTTAAGNYLLFLFLSLMNDGLQPPDVEFVLSSYVTLKQCGKLAGLYPYGYISSEGARVAIGQILSYKNCSLQGAVQNQLIIVQQQIVQKSAIVKTESQIYLKQQAVIDIGRVIHMCLKAREAILQYYLSLLPPEPLNYYQFLSIFKILGQISPQSNKLLAHLSQQMYTEAVLKNLPTTARNLLDESLSLDNGFVFDLIQEFYPVLQMNRLFYPQNKFIIQVRVPKQMIETSDIIATILIHQGHGVSQSGEPFRVKNIKVVGDLDQELIMSGYLIKCAAELLQQQPVMQNMVKLLTILMQGFYKLKYFKKNTEYVDVITEQINTMIEYLKANVNDNTEKKALFGFQFDEDVEIERLIEMTNGEVHRLREE
ncbi:Conserved_hypothetical protein [Hexamita inflata]|uniref:Uncharacterized protein n=1 Tax=Hexamita inflata TaxID=28002 RepID=A0AA86UM64_9EUKA|nr:Conserved hypothetical protein [Hexamita inflata]